MTILLIVLSLWSVVHIPSATGSDWVIKTFSEVGATCHNMDRHCQSFLPLDDCKNKAEELGFKFIYFQSILDRPLGERCHIYSSCDSTRIPVLGGTTYEFIGNVYHI